MVRSILVPLDGSTFGEHALPLAASLARKADGVLHLIHVHQVVPPATVAGVAIMDSLDIHLRQDEQAYLADVARRVAQAGPINVKTALIDGEVGPALAEFASRVGAELVVMSTHGRGALGRFWLGSVTDDLVHELARPLLLVHPGEGKPDLGRSVELKNVVVALDGTSHAEKILDAAMLLGGVFGAAFTLVRVVQPVLRPSYLPEGTGIMGLTHSVLEQVQTLQKQQQDEAQAYLDGVAPRLTGRGFRVQTRVVVDEQPAVGILLEAQARNAEVVALETHARRGLARLFLGSVADKIVRGSGLSVLLAHPQR
ncbi:MAG: universal stress protein [Gemmataceae bacterium]